MANHETLVPVEAMDGFSHIHIYAAYCKGGFNCLYGTEDGRGVYVFVIPVEYSGGIFTQRICRDCRRSGFKTLAKPSGRRSAKAEEKVWDAIKGHADEIARLFRESMINEACGLISTLTKDI